MTSKLRVGDTVLWSGGWGGDPPRKTKVKAIELCEPGHTEGTPVDEVDWSECAGRGVVVDLESGRWAYGFQLKPVPVVPPAIPSATPEEDAELDWITLARGGALVLLAALWMAPGHAADVEPLVIASHVSDPTDSSAGDLQTDFLGAGATITMRGVEIDLALGRKWVHDVVSCKRAGDHCGPTWGGMATLRWHPGRRR